MDHDLQHTVILLSRTPAVLDALLRGLPDAWIRSNEGEHTWSACDVIAHLIHAEREDWIPRATMILQSGESQPFPPFDRWGNIRESQNKPVGELLDTFAEARSANLTELRALNLQPADLAKRGQHPGLGMVTLGQLLDTWAAHDLNHLHQISRVMAHSYRQAVGPWSKFLGVMHCTGHSSS